MDKKIIAILLVFTLVITCFVACQKQKYETTNINGVDLLLATDENGNTMMNEDNQIVAVVTDREGEIITYENGEEQTYMVQISGSWVGDDYIRGTLYKMMIPKGWEGTEDHKIIKKDTNDKCYIDFGKSAEFGKNENIDTYLEPIDAQDELLIDGLAKEGYDLTVDKSIVVIPNGNINCQRYVYKVLDSEGKVVHYVENFYFVAGTALYSVNYVCIDGEGYDESFDFEAYLKESFTFNG